MTAPAGFSVLVIVYFENCSKRKTPCDLRLYGFKDEETKMLHYLLCAGMERISSPPGCRYALKRETHTQLRPSDFWSRCGMEPYSDLLGFEVGLYEVLEIDDGLKPVFFYNSRYGFTDAPYDLRSAVVSLNACGDLAYDGLLAA